MLDLLFNNPLYFLVIIIGLTIAITIHEFSHAWLADKLGDPTPRANGRLTLNPLAHLDPLGTLAIILTSFGWGKPVLIDPYNLKNPKKDCALISLAGPASNLILAGILGLMAKLIPLTPLPIQSLYLLPLIYPIITINLSLGLFNLLPVPPLDGSKILIGFLPHNLAYQLEETLEQYGLIFLLAILFPLFSGRSLASIIISPIINFFLGFLVV